MRIEIRCVCYLGMPTGGYYVRRGALRIAGGGGEREGGPGVKGTSRVCVCVCVGGVCMCGLGLNGGEPRLEAVAPASA